MLRNRPRAIAQLDEKQRQAAAAVSGLPSGRASVSAMLDVVADVNHFVPYSRQPSPPGSRRATVSLCETSEPPVRSVIHCPLVHIVAGSRLVSSGT